MSKKPPQNQSKSRSIWALVLLFGSPILLFAGLAALIYVPRLMANPKHDFVYSVCQTYNCSNYKFDASGKIVNYKKTGVNIIQLDVRSYAQEDLNDLLDDNNSGSAPYPKLYVYKQNDDSTSEISVDEYNALKLNRDKTSSDGYKLERTDFGGSVMFFGSSSNAKAWALKKGIASKPISLHSDETRYYSDRDVKFLGWVEDVK